MSPDSLRGRYLVAAEHLRDPNFFRSVLLVVEHGDAGAIGPIVNRPSQVEARRTPAHYRSAFHLPATPSPLKSEPVRRGD